MTERKDRYPFRPTARRGSPKTAFDAADSMTEVAASIRGRVFGAVSERADQGAIGDDVAAALELHVTQVRSRLSELHRAGKIVESGRTRVGASGRRGTVWVLPEYGPPPPPAADNGQGDLLAQA
jgi:predicted ArsR family transcriptional regulator